MPATRTIKVDYIPRVEGEGSLHIKLSAGRAKEVRLKIFEPPRLFEGLLQGRNYLEVPDIVARICGICPVAYQLSSAQAIESILGIEVERGIRQLRRLIYCGEWIESHALHIYMLHAPDFLGYPDIVHMAAHHGERVKAALRLKKAGNTVMSVLAGREIHPVNIRVGGLWRLPRPEELQYLVDVLQPARDIAIETVRWVSRFEFPELQPEYDFVALTHPSEYAMIDGRLVSNCGLDIPVEVYEDHFVERQVAYSNALHSVLRARGSYLVGPLARYNLNYSQLPPLVQELASEAGVAGGCRNPFQSIVVRALETVFACEEALRLIADYDCPSRAYAEAQPRQGIGHGCTEAPRGILYHRYELGAAGEVISARIVPPTAQNQKRIEEDLVGVVEASADAPIEILTHLCEQSVRNYDPCISCATHFLNLQVERE